ncbi:MAG: N-acetyltransferase [Pseudomonadota bacterium]
MIRKATPRDIKAVHSLIAEQAKDGHILARPISELYGQVRDFLVWTDDDSGKIIGCGSLEVVWEDLAEIRSLAVTGPLQRQGMGTRLAEALLRDAREMEIAKVFVLTYRVTFFERLGFTQMDKSHLPHKIWADCIRCTKFPECDETALVRSP